jgi:acetyl-CoA carboxylase biotin carboxylase subunit
MEPAFRTAAAGAEGAFGCGDLYLEKFIVDPRHVEVQLAGDSTGRVVHFFERDCSVQRRHQKLVEESPCPVLDERTRRRLGADAARGAEAVGYRSLGTMEFLLDREGRFYFMEMNTRLQVEHPVTEAVTGHDLVKLQILLAAGEPLPVRQEEIQLTGSALECRINAEDPAHRFRPSPGTVRFFHPPGGLGVRMDTHVYAGYRVSPFYDSLLGKLVVHGHSRAEAIQRMQRSLGELILEGVATTVPFHAAVMADPEFRRGLYDTSFAERLLARGLPAAVPTTAPAAAAGAADRAMAEPAAGEPARTPVGP